MAITRGRPSAGQEEERRNDGNRSVELHGRRLEPASRINSWLLDIDGVLLHESHAVAGADRFLTRLCEQGTPFLVLTNNSIYTRRDLAARLRVTGVEIPEGRDLDAGARHSGFPGGSAPGRLGVRHSARPG
jgi:hypothetical protein